ncbi:MAG: tripartite tricarboxylate transporter substrate binding protein [Rubrivivax sp.]
MATRRSTIVHAIALAATAVAAAPVAAQPAYPSRPINFVVAYTPGSANDILVRIVAPALGRELGQNVVVDNKPGAGGTLGTATVAKAKPDGYTLGLGSTATIAINRALFAKLSYDPWKNFTPVIAFGSTPNVLVVPASSPVKSFADLKQAAAAKSLNYSSPGNGTTQHLAGVLLERDLAPGTAAHIPFKGPAEQVSAVAGGQVDFGFASLPSAQALIRDGRVRGLGVTPLEPLAALPQVPTLASLGLKGYDSAGVWFGLVVPAGTPEPVLRTLHAAASRALADPDVKNKLVAAGYEPAAPASAESFARFVGEQVRFWEDLVKRSGATME